MSAISNVVPRRLALAGCLALVVGVDPTAAAATRIVSDCTDGSGSDTLRNTIAQAVSGDTVQIELACSRITLTQGHIPVASTISTLYITGQGAPLTTIDAGADVGVYDAAFIIGGSGRVRFTGVTITGAIKLGDFPIGGCIYSQGSVLLLNSAVTGCMLEPPATHGRNSKGGGIYALGDVTLVNSTVSGNVAFSADNHTAYGGGIYAKNSVILNYSTVEDNAAVAGKGGNVSRGGGIFAAGGNDVFIGNSTLSHNFADLNSALQAGSPTATSFALNLVSSTVAGNIAGSIQTIGTYGSTGVTNATIAFNRANTSNTTSPVGLYSRQPIAMASSIFAANTANAGLANDVASAAATNPLAGSNNLITATTNSPQPPRTVSACPLLGHLSNNGGPTRTIPLLPNSPAIDAGLADGQTTDQRGIGFVRIFGSAADIGAYERQLNGRDDVIFFAGFESRCN